MRKKILMAFDDPGGGLAVSSLFGSLIEDKDLVISVYAGKHNEDFLKKREISFNKINSEISDRYAEKIIELESPDLIVTGTSGGNAEQEFRNAAFRKNIRSVVILDFWKDYERRWKYASYNLNEMKDKICVMDEMTKYEMAEEGFPEENIIVTGHPYLDEIFKNDSNEKILNYGLNDLNEDHEKNKQAGISFLFLSQPLKVLGILDYKIHPLEVLLEAVRKLSKSNSKDYSLVIKLHPLEENSAELKSIVGFFNSENLRVEISDETNSLEKLITRSDAVIGYNSIALFEARALKKRTISLKAGPVRDSLLNAMSYAGIEIIDAEIESICECLQKDISNIPQFKNNMFKGGIENCVRVIKAELNLS